jgi:hypothetical protein
MLSALAILMSSLGGRYLTLDLDERQDRIFREPWVRRAVLFCILFLATRDLVASLLVATAVLLLLEWTRAPVTDL